MNNQSYYKIAYIKPSISNTFKCLCVDQGININDKILHIIDSFCNLPEKELKSIKDLALLNKKNIFDPEGENINIILPSSLYERLNKKIKKIEMKKSVLLRYLLSVECKKNNKHKTEKKDSFVSIYIHSMPFSLHKKIKKKAIKEKKTKDECIIEILENFFSNQSC